MLRRRTFRFLYFLIFVVIVSLACFSINPDAEFIKSSETPEIPEEGDFQQDADVEPVAEIQPDANRWDIYQCNAIQEVNITLTEFEEFQYEDGVVECSYGYEITNLDDIRIIYHSYFHYGDVDPVSHDDGWVSHGFGPNLEVYTLRSSLSNCPNCTPVRWESVLLTIAVIYDRPECEWITENGVHFDVMYIAEEEPVMCPCTLLYPEHFPDITEGLIRN